MQIKKFEARTMKEALEMVKTQLGPDAIILSARDNNRSFGLIGEGSVEITAAVSEETLHKKKFAESRLREEDKVRLQRSPARVQKQVINQMVDKYTIEREERAPKQITRTRYIEIDDDNDTYNQQQAAAERIKNAAQRAWSEMANQNIWTQAKPLPKPQTSASAKPAKNAIVKVVPTKAEMPSASPKAVEVAEINLLKGEIEGLRQVIAQFQHMPQNFNQGRHPGSDYGLSYDLSPCFEKLTQAGIADEIAGEMLAQAQEEMPALKLKNKSLIEAWAAKHILTTTNVASPKQAIKMQVFVGPAGTGKTASLIKLASHLVVRENKKVALVTTDTLKVGASDQMRIYAQILNVPFAVIRQKGDWDKIMAQLSNYDQILVDFSGFSLKSMEEISLIRSLLPPDSLNPQVHLVLSSLAKDTDLTEIGKRYKVTNFQDVIFTGLDESNQHGSIYNFMKRFSVPLHSFGIGTRVPEDFEMATKERVLDLIFKITKMNRLEQTSQQQTQQQGFKS